MAINKETRINKSNTLEQFRQKTNEISLHLGDTDQLNSNLSDKTYNYVDVADGASLFHTADDNAKSVRFEISPEHVLDNTGGYIILKDVVSLTGFLVNNTVTQTGGFTGTVVSSSTDKILVVNTSGNFSSSQDLTDGTNIIAAANIDRIVVESYNVGIVRVYKNSTEIPQDMSATGFHVVNIAGTVPILNSPDVSDITEGLVLNQSNGFTGTVLKATSTELLFKSMTNASSFNAGANLRFPDNTAAIQAANHGALTEVPTGYGVGIELNTPAALNDDIKLVTMDTVAAINELQDDVGVTENLTTSATNLVNAINEHDAELGTISPSAMGTTASTVETAIREHEDQIGNQDISSIAPEDDTLTRALNQLHTEVGTLSLNTSATDLTAAVNELEADLFNVEGGSKRTVGDLLTSDNSSIVDAINELHTELFDTGVSFSGLSADDFKSAVVELRTELGDHTALATDATSNLVLGINELEAAARGANANYNLDTAAGNFRDGINELYADIHTDGSVTLNTNANFLVGGINELETALRGTNTDYTLTTTAQNFRDAIREHETDIGNMTFTGITATDISGALRELRTELGDITAINSSFVNDSNVVVALNELQTEVGANAYPSGGPADTANATNLTNAINAIDAEIGDTSYTGADITTALSTAQTNIGTIGNLTTTATNLVGAVNEHELQINSNDTDIGNLMTLIDGASTVDSSIAFGGNLAATNLRSAIIELDSEKLNITSSSQQSINSELQFTGDISFVDGGTNADTFTFGSGTVLDVSNASILLPGSASNVNIFSVAFLEVDGNIETPMGFSVDRQHVSTIADTSDVRIQWNENHADGTSATKPARGWQLQGLDDSSTSHTTDIVTFYNAKELIANNTESGINVSWDATNENFDFNVNDFTVTLGTGPISGSFSVTDLGNATFNTTLDNNSVTLGTHTTGSYVRRILGTSNEIEVSANDVENASVTIGLPNSVDIVDLDVTGTTNSTSSTTGALTVAGGLGVAEDVYIGGDLVVQGDTVTLNTETLTVEDTLVLAGNNLVSEPTSGGFGLEVGPITSPSGVATGVTGAHSIVYNYANDRWEADGSLILSEATLGSPTIEGNTFAPSNNLDFIGGTGISVSTVVTGGDIDVTITNTLDGYSGWFLSTQGTDRGNIADDERVDFHGGTALTATYDTTNNNRVIFNHDNIGAGAATYGQTGTEDGTYIKSIVVNAQGHVTAVTADDFDDRYDNYQSWTARDADGTSYTVTSGDVLTFAEGNGIDVNFSGDDNLLITNTKPYDFWILEDGDGTEVSISNQNEVKFVEGSGTGATIDINWTDTTPGSDADPYDLTFTVNNTDRGSSQNIFKNVASQSGTAVADNNNDTLTITGSTGISTSVSDDTLSILNTDRGSSQFIFKNIQADSGGTATANINNDTLVISGGSGLNSVRSGDTITINHDDTSSQSSVDNSGNTFIQDITLDTFGHITGISSGSVSVGNGTLTMNTSGNGISGSQSFTANQSGAATFTVTSNATTASTANTIAYRDSGGDIHARLFRSEYDTTNSNIGVIMTQVNTGSDNYIRPSTPAQVRSALNVANGATNTTQPNNGTITISAGTALSGGGSFTVDQSGNSTVTINHADTSSQASVNNSGRTYIQDITLDTHGHITGITSATETVVNTDTNTITNIGVANTNYTNGNINFVASGATSITKSGNTVTISSTDTNTDTNNYVNAGTYSNGTLNLTGPGLNFNVTGFNTFGGNTYSNNMNQYVRTTDSVKFDALRVGDTSAAPANTIQCTGDIVAYASSDERLKDNIKPIENSLEKVNKLTGYEFDWNDNQNVYEGHDIGVIAQEVEKVIPEIVETREHDGYMAVKYEKLTALLINAVNELTEQNKQLRSDIEDLKRINNR